MELNRAARDGKVDTLKELLEVLNVTSLLVIWDRLTSSKSYAFMIYVQIIRLCEDVEFWIMHSDMFRGAALQGRLLGIQMSGTRNRGPNSWGTQITSSAAGRKIILAKAQGFFFENIFYPSFYRCDHGFLQACANGQESCVKVLLDYGALSSAHKTNGFTPLHYAAAGGHVSIVRLLISR